MNKKERAEEVRKILDVLYPNVKCSLEYSTPVQMLIATQLSAQCTDARVNIVCKDLFKKYKDAKAFANADYEELMDDIRSIGFYRNKAKNIILCCQRLCDVYNGEVPDSMEELLTLAGTGRKTANLVLGDIFGKPAVVVDTHCKRVSARIGLTKEQEPEKIERDLEKIIPAQYRLRICHQFVSHGRAVCNARSPKCGECALFDVCKRVGVKN